jgi:hypothetical protein
MIKSIPVALSLLIVLSFLSGSCKHEAPTETKTCDTCIKCDTCKDTTHHCDTCNVDTTHHPTPNDTTSHNFRWSQSTISGEGILTGCWVFGTQNIYVVGGAVWKWDGVKWTDVSPAYNGSLSGELSGSTMFAFSEKDYWLTYGGLIFHSDGRTAVPYSFSSSTISGPLHSSWGTSSANMYSVGDGGTILHFDGTNWTRMVSGTTLDIKTIWGTSSQNIWACGYAPRTAASVLLHYDGNAWSMLNLGSIGDIGPGHQGLDAVWTCDSAGHTVTIASGSLLFRQTDAGHWRSDSGMIKNRLGDGSFVGMFNLRGNNSNDVVVAGDLGFVSHWNGVSWLRYDNLFNPGDGLLITNALSMNGNTTCVVGANSAGAWVAIGQR